ncbi:MAG: hypothetical protein NT166_23755 [Candidatus Aminicenantes bacterium]|nr:hypothetical protein [Candidatus Aminicenantes bacterium]
MKKKSILIILFSVLSVMVTQISKAAVITVTTTHDNVPGSLRAAITTANTNGEDNTIYLPAGTYMLRGSAMENANTGGDLDIGTRCKLSIIGKGKYQTYIHGNSIDRVLHISYGTISIANLTIRKGHAPDSGIGRKDGESGGGIYNNGDLTLIGCVIKENNTGDGSGDRFSAGNGGHGGGIFNYGLLTIKECIIASNSAGNGGDSSWYNGGDGGQGGAIDNHGTLNLNNCTITGNRSGSGGYGHNNDGSGGDGGGIFNCGNLTMSGCTVNNNVSCPENAWNCGSGGGICNQGYLLLINCTISGNKSGEIQYPGNGGGIYNYGESLLSGVTIFNNSYGGINNNGAIRLANSIVANNWLECGEECGEALDCYGTFDWVCYSLIEDTSGCTLTGFQKANILGMDPLLGPLADNGGPAKTHALLPGSPAIDAGNSAGVSVDQRGFKRPINIPGIPNVSDGADIGAYEYIPFSTACSLLLSSHPKKM